MTAPPATPTETDHARPALHPLESRYRWLPLPFFPLVRGRALLILYNENDPKTAAWLRELVTQGNIAQGTVDERSIEELEPDDIPDTFHAFAGIGGWPYALDLAGWDSAEPVWSGSCPCQPFSAAGKQYGVEDERHLWPAWFRLIRELRPRTIFGEQVAGAVGFGWLDGVFADLEAEGYRCGSVVLGAHSVGAPHIRQRLFWVADSQRDRRGAQRKRGGLHELREERANDRRASPQSGAGSGVADADGGDTRAEREQRSGEQRLKPEDGGVGERVAESQAEQRDGSGSERRGGSEPSDGGRLGHADESTQERQRPIGISVEPEQEAGRPGHAATWAGTGLVGCADGKARVVKSSIQCLAHGVPARVVRLRGYGNAIVPQVAAEFIRAFMDTREEQK